MDEFKNEKIIAVGWPYIGNLHDKKKDDIKKIIDNNDKYNYSKVVLGNVASILDIFVNRMEIGDLILTPYGDNIYFGRITGDYNFDEEKDNEEGYPHQRHVEWSAYETLRENLSMKLRLSLKNQRTISDLSKHFDEIEALSKGEKILFDEELEVNGSKTSLPTNVIEVKYPLRPGFEISFVLPKDLSKKESERLSLYFSTLYFEE